MHTVFNKMRTQ